MKMKVEFVDVLGDGIELRKSLNVRMKCKDGCMYLMKDKKYMVSFECDMLDVDNKRLKLRGLSVGRIYGLL